MGFNVVALAQKARTETLIVDSDLDMGQYDVTATDVKGDTAEFSEFVGGVGNFSNGIVSGKFDVGGILHAESNLQVDGGISLEGSINNVNITPDGHINAPMVQTQTLKLPVSNTGTFAIGTISMKTLSKSVGSGIVNEQRTYNFGTPAITSTIPSVFGIPTTPSTKTVEYSFNKPSVALQYDFYQNDVLLYTSTSNTGSFELADFEHDIVVTWTTISGGASIGSGTSKISKASETFYLA